MRVAALLCIALLGCGAWPVGRSPTQDALVEVVVTDGDWTLRRGQIACGYPVGDGDTIRLFAHNRGSASTWSFTDAEASVAPTPICAALQELDVEHCPCSGAVCLTLNRSSVCNPERYLPLLAKSLWANAELTRKIWQDRPPEGAIRLRWPTRDTLVVDHHHTAAFSAGQWSVVDESGEVHVCDATVGMTLPSDFGGPRRAEVVVPIDTVGPGCSWDAGRLHIAPELLANSRVIRLRGLVPVARDERAPGGTLAVWPLQVQAARAPISP